MPDATLRRAYGFVGLGNIGFPMAERLTAAGFEPVLFDRCREAGAPLVHQGARLAVSLAELASQCSVIGICVRDDRDVRDVTLGTGGLFATAARGTTVAIHSTVLPATVIEVGRIAAERGIDVVDAPISGGAAGARNGTLTYMVGGAVAVLERCRSAFETSARRIIHCGNLGSGAATKLCNNLMGYMSFLAAFEAGNLARAAGLSIDALMEVTGSNGLMPETTATFLRHRLNLENQPPSAERDRMRMSFADLAEKDLALTLQFAEEHGVSLPATTLCKHRMGDVYGSKGSGQA